MADSTALAMLLLLVGREHRSTVDATLRVTGRATEDHSVPADVLVRSVQGVQQSVLLLGALRGQIEIRARFKPDQLLRKRYTLRLSPAEPGSYAVPMTLADERVQTSMNDDTPDDLLGLLIRVWDGIARDAIESIRQLVPDENYRVRLLQEVQKMLPRTGDSWAIALGAPAHPEVELTHRHRHTVTRWLESTPDKREMAVIGELLVINFAEKRLVIRYPPTNMELDCSYLEEVEDSIVDARRGMFQVTGQFVLDENGHPKRLTDVRSVQPVDFSPAVIAEVAFAAGRLVLSPPLSFDVSLDPDTQQYLVAFIPEFGFSIGGSTRDALLQDFEQHLQFAWEEYALADEDALTDDAKALRIDLLARVRQEHS